MMETRLGDRSSPGVGGPLECYDQVEVTARHQALAARHGSGARLVRRRADGPLVRMGRKKPDAFGRGARPSQERMQRLDGGDALQVSVAAGMVVRPGNGAGFAIVGGLPTRI